MKILIIGGGGFIGSYLVEELLSNDHQVVVSSRDPVKATAILGEKPQYIKWDGVDPTALVPHLEGVDAVVNLAGENIGALRRWSASWKQKLYDSRIITGKAIAQAILTSNDQPELLIQGSASGIYGTKAMKPVGEKRKTGDGFLAELTQDWENSVQVLEDSPIRLAYMRTGIILAKDSIFLKRLLLAFRFGMGVIPGGRQWISWIHIQDVVGAIRFILENPKASGPFNLTSPEPVTMKHLVKKIGKVRKLPAWISIPPFALKMILGEMAKETILSSQDVIPEALLDAGYLFDFNNIEDALADLLKH